MVYVISKTGQPIMPTENHAKVRLLLKSGKAKVVQRTPFTIQLTGTNKTYTQDVTLGVYVGSKHVGLSATTTKKELFAAELRPRNDVVELLSARREFRSARRNRKTRYREQRFSNRVHSKHKGWLAPSVEVKINNHIQDIKMVAKILPIKLVRVETAEFDLQRLKAMMEGKPLPVGTDYQLGEQYDFYNTRQYILHRDGYQCVCCGAKPTKKTSVKFHVDSRLHTHHLESRKIGGNAPDNLITLCEKCHKLYHAGKLELPTKKRKLKSTRDATFMGIMRKTLIERLRTMLPTLVIQETKGYITKYWRERKNIEKTHINDAFVIAKNFDAKRISGQYIIVPKRSHNRQIHKATVLKGGYRKRNQAPHEVFGFRLFDKVVWKGQECFVFGRRSSGRMDLRLLDGTKINASVGYKNIRLLEMRKNNLIEYRKVV